MKDAIKWIALGLGAYWVYEQFFATPAAATTTPAATTPAATTPAVTTPTFNSLAAIYGRMVAAAPRRDADGGSVEYLSCEPVFGDAS